MYGEEPMKRAIRTTTERATKRGQESNTGVYILENTPPPGKGKYQLMSFGEKNMKRGREKG